MNDKSVEYVFYAITQPARVGRKIVGAEVYATRRLAKQKYLSLWHDLEHGEREWRRCRADGWRIERVMVRLDMGAGR